MILNNNSRNMELKQDMIFINYKNFRDKFNKKLDN